MTPLFWGFSIRLGPYFIPQNNPIDPIFLQKKIDLFLSHLVPEILGPKVGPFFTKMYYLIDFKHFVSIFSLIFDPIDPIGSKMCSRAEPGYRKCDEEPPTY